MNESENKREFKVLTDIEHVLLRPNMYIGGINLTEKEQWIYDRSSGRFRFGTVKYVPALVKCASELIDNSIDVAIDTNFEKATKIQVNVDDKSIEVIDNGIGIPCEPPKNSPGEKRTCAEIAWTTLKSGTSFGENRNKIGTNGVGSSCVNVFSKLFIGESDDGRRSQTITCRNNLSEIKAGRICKSSGKSGVRVYCEPDLERFGLEKIDDVHRDLIYQRLVNLAISYPKIKFVFNKEKIEAGGKKIPTMFSDDCVMQTGSNFTVCVFPNEYDEFKFYSYVNGIDMIKGGTHVDYISYELTSRIRDKLIKKYKSIRPGDVKNKLSLVVFFTGFANPEFDSQTKESLSNSQGDITRHLDGKLDFDMFAKAVFKNEAIIDPIIETFKIKEELKARRELKAVKKTKVRSDKYMGPIGSRMYLALCEGASAMSGISSCLGRNGIGYYAMRGVPLNAYDSTMQKIVANQELKDILNILGLDIAKTEGRKDIDFERILITTDADADGNHITAMLIGWFCKFAPNLFGEGRVCKLVTPLIVVKDQKDKMIQWFFNVPDFKAWEAKNSGHKYKIVYLKGLGSWAREDLIELIDKNGLQNFILEFKLDEDGKVYVEDWLGSDAEKRKKYLREYTFDINQA